MLVYIITLLLVLLLIYEYHIQTNKKIKNAILFFIAVVLIFVAGFRYKVGTDYVQYMRNYYGYVKADWDFYNLGITLVAKVASFIYNDYVTFFVLMAIITVGISIFGIYKNSNSIGFAIIIYILLGCWHTSFNIVKQCAAVSILFLGYSFLQNRKFIKWCIVCFVASLFHITALLMIPVFFVAKNKVSFRNIAIMIMVGIVCALGYDRLFDLVGFLKQGEGVINFNSEISTKSVNLLRVLVSCAPIAFVGICYKRYDFNDPKFSTSFNLSFFNMVLNICSAQSIYMSRFCLYTNIFNVIFIPFLFKPFKKDDKLILYSLLFIAYFVFWYYDLYKGSTTVQYQWIFNR